MKKKILVSVIGCILAIHFVGCGVSNNANTNDYQNASAVKLGEFITIEGAERGTEWLMYDSITKIVYYKTSYVFTPYYAPNGLPYRYNPETDTLEKIDYSPTNEQSN